MKTAEFLNTKANYMLQVLPEHAGNDPESGLVRVPEGADIYTLHDDGNVFYNNNVAQYLDYFKDEKWRSTNYSSDNFVSEMLYLGRTVVWQRNTLQQKVDEVRQHLGITNNNTLSVMIGREKSYLRKLLKRKASSATIEKVIADLDALIVVRPTIDSQSDEMIKQGEIDAENCQTIDKPITIALENPMDELKQDYINELKADVKQANDIAEMREANYKQSSKLNAWLFLIIILFIGLFIAWWSL